ncbi:MAG: adenosylcobinamide-GDP ribazoletransferase [Pseudomonadota bacterium]|nr:adenosylcobinamide-GDP ribazoletransferase [Pseudomonadota bacterium]
MFDDDERDQAAKAPERRGPGAFLSDIIAATGFLTRLPVGARVSPAPDLRQAMSVFPLAGLLVGLLSAAALLVATRLGLSPLAAAAIAVGTHFLVTGGLHEDGLADTADGFWGGDKPQRRLAIMRDSAIGTYGVLALLLAVILKCALIAELAASNTGGAAAVLVASGAISRHAMVALMAANDSARSDGLAVSAGKPSAEARRQSLILAVAIAAVALWWAIGILAVVLSLLLAQGAVSGMALLARQKIGGYTGDVCGAVQQASEIGVLAGAAMVAG